MTDRRDDDAEAVAGVAEPGDSAQAIARKLGGERAGWHRVRVHRAVERMGVRRPAESATEARRRRVGDAAVTWRRRRR